jgi:hypothetical protein
MIYQYYSMLGLFADILGAFILFKTGLPLMPPEMTWGSSSEEEVEFPKKLSKNEKLAKWGIKLLILGFLLQLFTTFISIS